MNDPNAQALLILAHALRLNTTAPQPDQGFEAWPRDPYEVMDRVRALLLTMRQQTKATCAAAAILDLSVEEPWLVEQPDLLMRMNFLASQPRTSGSPA